MSTMSQGSLPFFSFDFLRTDVIARFIHCHFPLAQSSDADDFGD